MTQTHHGRAGGGRGGVARLTVPSDFAVRAVEARNADLCAHYGVCVQIVFRWRLETGVKGKATGGSKRIAMPEDFAETAATARNAELSARYGVNISTIGRWRREAGIRGRVGAGNAARHPCRDIPADFKAVAPGKTMKALRNIYGARHQVLLRWFAESGVERYRPARKAPAPTSRPKSQPFQRAVAPKPRAYAGPKSAFTATLPRNVSTEGQAADFLRRDTRVFGCTAEGRYVDDPKKRTHWLYGTRVMTGAELVERARAKGWNPEGWRQVAAPPQFQGASL